MLAQPDAEDFVRANGLDHSAELHFAVDFVIRDIDGDDVPDLRFQKLAAGEPK